MTEFVMTLKGADLVRALHRDCELSVEAARRFIETKTGEPFDEETIYCVGYLAGQTGLNWTKFVQLRIWKHVPTGS